MDIRVWMVIDTVIFAAGIILFAIVSPGTLWSFIPNEELLPLLWADMGLFAVGVGLLYELVEYVRKYGID